MQFITTDQRIAVENFEVGLIYTVTFSNGDSFTGACIGIGPDFVAFQRTAPKLLFCLTMTTAADVASIEPLSVDIGKILAYTGSVPVSIKTDGTPLLDYLITGSTIQNGTPTPENPIMPQGTGERTGNLVFVSVDNLTYFSNYNQFTISDGTITVTGRMLIGFKVKVTPNTTYTVSAVYSSRRPLMRIREYTEIPDDWIEGFIGQPVNTNDTSATFTTSSEAEWILVAFYSEVVGVTIDKVMLNTGSTALPYEPYGYKITISSASTTTPVYLGEVETTRKIRKLVLDGTETITEEPTNVYSIPINDTVTAGAGLSTHFEYDSTVLAGQFRIEAGKAVFGYNDTLANFSAFLAAQYAAGTPVTVWYVLSTEKTAVVNEPLMRIGDYADTLSYRQSDVNIPTTDGLNIFDIDTTVKPSEVYLKYFSPLF